MRAQMDSFAPKLIPARAHLISGARIHQAVAVVATSSANSSAIADIDYSGGDHSSGASASGRDDSLADGSLGV